MQILQLNPIAKGFRLERTLKMFLTVGSLLAFRPHHLITSQMSYSLCQCITFSEDGLILTVLPAVHHVVNVNENVKCVL